MQGRIDVLTRREQDVPQQTAVGVLVVAGRVRDEPDGRACEPGAGVGGRFGAVRFDTLRRVYRLGRVHAGEPHGVAIPISQPNADGVAVDHARYLGGSDVRRPESAGRQRDERSEHGCEAHDTCSSPHTGRRAPRHRDGSSIRSISQAFLLAS